VKRRLLVLVFLCAVTTVAAQSRKDLPDFSGTWIRDDSATSRTTTYSYPFGVTCEPTILEIFHKTVELEIRSTINCFSTQKGKYQIKEVKTYYTDGRGEFNDLTGASTTKWDGKKIETIFTARMNGKDTKWRQIYEIAKKSDKITIRRGVKENLIQTYMTEVYRK